jgi:hypothetical protein
VFGTIFLTLFFVLIYHHSYTCRGSGSTWVRIHLAILDPDPYWECGSGSGTRSMEIGQYLQINLVFCLSKRFLYLRWYVFDLLPRIFKNKNKKT